MINPKTAMFGAISIFLYTSVYTPLKRSHHYPFLWVLFRSYSVYVRLGCSDDWDRSWTLFLIQFFWHLHFWAIGWFLYEDYEKGFYVANR
jgi:protoheme IX farnesyltransferase